MKKPSLKPLMEDLEQRVVVEDIMNATAIGSGDSSFKDEFETTAWMIENTS